MSDGIKVGDTVRYTVGRGSSTGTIAELSGKCAYVTTKSGGRLKRQMAKLVPVDPESPSGVKG